MADGAAAADVASGKLVSVEPKSESRIVTSTGVEPLSAASQARRLQSKLVLLSRGEAAEAAADVARGEQGNCEPTSEDEASLSAKLPSAAGDATELQSEVLLS